MNELRRMIMYGIALALISVSCSSVRTVTVLDSNGNPVPNARVNWFWSDMYVGVTTKHGGGTEFTNDKGQVVIEGIKPLEFNVTKSGYREWRYPRDRPGGMGTAGPLTIMLKPDTAVR